MKNPHKKITVLVLAASFLGVQLAFAFQPKETSRYFNGPTVSAITDTSARIGLSQAVLQDISAEEKSGVYFQYIEKDMVCIAIYPTPESCLPKKTSLGKIETDITNLKPSTTYTVVYKRDNTIYCITAPCPGNEFESLVTEFTTKPSGTPATTTITSSLFLGLRGSQVAALQNFLIGKGYMNAPATGYFGFITLRAVMNFQRDNDIPTTGFVGPLTRKAIAHPPVVAEEMFEGTITAYSVQCFVDGECSISVDGKKIVTTLGWTQGPLGTVTGIPDFGSIEQKVGSKAKVYAKKTADGYTLYGSSKYYVQVQ